MQVGDLIKVKLERKTYKVALVVKKWVIDEAADNLPADIGWFVKPVDGSRHIYAYPEDIELFQEIKT